MTGFASLFAVEARTMWRTWHRYALPVVLVFLAALSVALSRFAPELFKALAGEGFQIELPEPSPDQSYAQWAKNLTQTGVFLVIFSGAGATSALISSGRAQLLAVRPVSRAAQPVAAFLARALVVGSSCLAGAAVVWVGTFAAYSEAPVAPLAAASCSWIVCALAFLAISVGLSAMIGSTLGAVGASIGVYVVCTLLALAEPGRYSPAGLVSLPSAIASGGVPEGRQPNQAIRAGRSRAKKEKSSPPSPGFSSSTMLSSPSEARTVRAARRKSSGSLTRGGYPLT